MKNFVYIISFFWVSALFAQAPVDVVHENIVPNPSFEKYSGTPIGWFYKGQHFTDIIKYWSSATAASPDVFGPKVRVPSHWAAKGFGDQKAKSGQSMVGITVYGCNDGKPHCREYVQIQLREPLVVGQKYLAECFVSHLPRSIQVNNIGMYFSKEKIDLKMDQPIEADAQIFSEGVLAASYGQWVKVNGTFDATTEAEYLIIGNFTPDSLTKTRVNHPNSLKYAYYYVDDIMVKKIPPFLDVPVAKDDLSLVKVEKGKIIQLKDIFFDTDRSEILPRSHLELQKLLNLLRQYPTMQIEISGHTDNVGVAEHNLSLSLRRAKSVVDYLVMHGIEPRRLLYKGYGDTYPISDNETEYGRQLNRRVQMLILQK